MNTNLQKAINLRFEGKSYGEINYVLGIPKSTLSYWLKNLNLPPSAQKILQEKDKKTRTHLIKFNERRTESIQIENKKIRKSAADEIKNISEYELLLIGAALYWAEGYNNQNKSRSPYLSFGNSDPDMIILFLQFLKKIMYVPDENLRPIVQVHPNVKIKPAINFWAKTTGIPAQYFHITHQTSRASKGKRSTRLLPYGTLRLDVKGRLNFFRIKGWIDGLKNKSILN